MKEFLGKLWFTSLLLSIMVVLSAYGIYLIGYVDLANRIGPISILVVFSHLPVLLIGLIYFVWKE